MGAMAVAKGRIVEALLAQLDRDIESLIGSQKASQEGATHEEARPESDKDTRATEASYLARGLAARVDDLRAARKQLAALDLREVGTDRPIGMAAVVTVERDDGDPACYFVAPAGGGRKVEVDGTLVVVVTPSSPLGQALIGRRIDDEARAQTPQGVRQLTIVDVV